MTALKNKILYFLWMAAKGFFFGWQLRVFSNFFHPLAKINDIKWWVANSLHQLVMTDFIRVRTDALKG
jgi:hypothetical protein